MKTKETKQKIEEAKGKVLTILELLEQTDFQGVGDQQNAFQDIDDGVVQ